jgi:hypothetical protein
VYAIIALQTFLLHGQVEGSSLRRSDTSPVGHSVRITDLIPGLLEALCPLGYFGCSDGTRFLALRLAVFPTKMRQVQARDVAQRDNSAIGYRTAAPLVAALRVTVTATLGICRAPGTRMSVVVSTTNVFTTMDGNEKV